MILPEQLKPPALGSTETVSAAPTESNTITSRVPPGSGHRAGQ